MRQPIRSWARQWIRRCGSEPTTKTHVAAETDARGVVTTSEYDAAGRLASVTVTDFHEPGGGTRALVVGEYSYDAAGHLLQQITGGGLRTETFAYDEAGRLLQHTLDPAGLGRATTFVYDAGDNVLMTVWADGTRTETLSATYDVAGRQVSATLENGDDDLTTTYVYDQRGMRTAVVDARGNAPGANPSDFRTTSQFDEPQAVERPPVARGSDLRQRTERQHAGIGAHLRVQHLWRPDRST